MKKILFIVAITGLTLKSNAQTYIALEDTSGVYAKVDVDPVFPGGFQMFDRYIDDNSNKFLKPDHALGTVVAGFFVEKTGRIARPKIIKGLTAETDSAAVYLLKNSPLWKPGVKNGLTVKTYVKIAVKFIYSGTMRPVHVQDVILSKGQDADVTIDEPVSPTGADSYYDNKIFTSVEQMPQFPGGYTKLHLYIKDNFRMPENSDGLKGRVIVSFLVEKDGGLTDIKVARGLSPDIDKEALRIIRQSPKWQPGVQNGRIVRVAYSVPIPVNIDN